MIPLQTKTKYIDHTFSDVPPLDNNYGSLNNILKKVLVEGFNHQTPYSIEILPEEKSFKLSYEAPHGYSQESVISLEGCDQDMLNKEYRIIETGGLYLKVSYQDISEGVDSVSTSTAYETKTAPLGFTLAFNDDEENTSCYKNSSKEFPAVLKVIDTIPGNGYKTSWSKYARVVAGNNIDSEGNFINNSKAPCHPDYPDAESTGNNGSSGSRATIYGYAKWTYATRDQVYAYEVDGPDSSTSFPRSWKIIGDSNTFYFILYVNNTWNAFTFGLLTDGSICLTAEDRFIEAGDYEKTYNQKNYYHWPTLDFSSSGCFLYKQNTSYKINTQKFLNTGLLVDTDNKQYPWRYDYIKTYNPFSGKVFSSKLGVKDKDKNFLGYHRGLQVFYSKDYPATPRLTGTPYMVVSVTESYNSGIMPFLFTLENWEYPS